MSVMAALLFGVVPRCPAWSAEGGPAVMAKALIENYRCASSDESNVAAAASFIERFATTPALLESVLIGTPRQDVRSACAEVLSAALTCVAVHEEDSFLETNSCCCSGMDVEGDHPSPASSLATSSDGSSSSNSALRIPPPGTPKAVAARFMDACLRELDALSEYPAAYTDYFGLIASFANIGAREVEYLLDRRVVPALLDLFVGNGTSLPPVSTSPSLVTSSTSPSTSPSASASTITIKRKRTATRNGVGNSNSSGLVRALAAIVAGCKTHDLYDNGQQQQQQQQQRGLLRLPYRDRERLLQSDLYERAFGCGLTEEPLAVLYSVPCLTEQEWPSVAKLTNIGFERLPAASFPAYAACLAERLSTQAVPPQFAGLLAHDLLLNVVPKKPARDAAAILTAFEKSLVGIPGVEKWLRDASSEWAPPLLLFSSPSSAYGCISSYNYNYGNGYSSASQQDELVPAEAYKILVRVVDFSNDATVCKLLDELLKALKPSSQCSFSYAKTLVACIKGVTQQQQQQQQPSPLPLPSAPSSNCESVSTGETYICSEKIEIVITQNHDCSLSLFSIFIFYCV